MIRPLNPCEAEYQALVDVHDAVWPDLPTTPDYWRHEDRMVPDDVLCQRLVVEVDGKIVAFGEYGEPWWSRKPGKYFVELHVHPDWQRRGIGSAAYDHMLAALAGYGPRSLTARTREDRAGSVRFLEARGFERVMRFPTSELRVDAFDFAPFEGVWKRMAAQRVEIVPLSTLQERDPDWPTHLWQLWTELARDVPSPDPITPRPLEQFLKERVEHPDYRPEFWFIALDGERWVGGSNLWPIGPDPTRIDTGLTGVLRSHRRQGICTALKLSGFAYARERGVRTIVTDNEENNPMYAINLKLGFEPRPAWLSFTKTFEEQS